MPQDRNFVAFSIEGGLHYLGAIPGRDHDALGLGVAYIGISDQVAAAVRDTNHRDQTSHRQADFEATIELVYRYQVAPWCSIQPHAQYVVQPGGTTERVIMRSYSDCERTSLSNRSVERKAEGRASSRAI